MLMLRRPFALAISAIRGVSSVCWMWRYMAATKGGACDARGGWSVFLWKNVRLSAHCRRSYPVAIKTGGRNAGKASHPAGKRAYSASTLAVPTCSAGEPTLTVTFPGVFVRTMATARPSKAWQRAEVY